jgi:hypothetical protein
MTKFKHHGLQVETPDEQVYEEHKAAFLADTLDIRGMAYGVDTRGCRVQSFVLDAEHRPDVCDLVRVHTTDGPNGDFTLTTNALLERDQPVLIIFTVEMTAPVVCTFKVKFVYQDHKDALWDVVKKRRLMFDTDWPPVGEMSTGLLLVLGQDIATDLNAMLNKIIIALRIWKSQPHG